MYLSTKHKSTRIQKTRQIRQTLKSRSWGVKGQNYEVACRWEIILVAKSLNWQNWQS